MTTKVIISVPDTEQRQVRVYLSAWQTDDVRVIKPGESVPFYIWSDVHLEVREDAVHQSK